MSDWRQFAHFLALRRNTALLLGALVLAGLGERFWLGFAPKYLETLGAGIFVIGVFDALQTLLGALYAYPGGWLTDHLGQRRSLLLFSALSLSGYAIVLLWHHWLALFLGALLFLAWSGFSLPATFTVVATSLEQHQHTMGVGVQSMIRRVPMMLGPLFGGWLITRFGWQQGIQVALLCCVLLGAITFVFQWFIVDPTGPDAPSKTAPKAKRMSLREVVRSFTPALRQLLVSDILIRFCERIPYAFVILWAMNHAGVSAGRFGVLTAIEMITAMLCYIPVAHFADKHGQRPFVLATFVFFTLFPLSLLWADNFAWLAVAFAIRGLKEFGEPARKALIIAQAAPELRSRTYGAYYLIRDCIVTLGSFLGAWLWSVHPRVNFLVAAAGGLGGTILFGFSFWRDEAHKRSGGTKSKDKPSQASSIKTLESKNMKRWLAASVLSLFVFGAVTRAVPPLVTDDPGTAERSQFELYTGFEYLSEDHTITRRLPAFELNYGVTDQLQLTFAMPYLSTQGAEGFGDATLELKYNFLKDPKKLPDMSAVFEWTLPTGSFPRGLGNGAADYFFHLPVQKTWGWFTALGDFGYTIVGEPSIEGMREPRKNTWFIGFAQQYQVTKDTKLLSEIYWETSPEPGKPNTFAAQVGFEKEIVKDFTLQAAIGRSLREGAVGGPDLRAYVGIHWVFDAPWRSKEKDKDKK